ncbi:MCE family protein [Mycolicibacterium sp.]|uniref:MCE family protein n=1 Tax=Mycolicibacterium sp. TaxID=2320850 RepID=UPI003D0BF821
MNNTTAQRIRPAWWALLLGVVLTAIVAVCTAMFQGSFTRHVPVTLTSDRAGLVLEAGAKVKMRGVQVGRVAGVEGGTHPVRLQLQIFADQIAHIPANVSARIRSTTIFGAKYVDLEYPRDPNPARLHPGAVLASTNVSTEVNTVFGNMVDLLDRVDPAKLNAVLTAMAHGVRSQGDRIGTAITAADTVLREVNPRMPALQQDWQAFNAANTAYADSAADLLVMLDAASTTSATLSAHTRDLDALLLSTLGFARSGTDLLASSRPALVDAVNVARPTTGLLAKYDPQYTCLLVGTKSLLDNSLYQSVGGNGMSVILDSAALLGNDMYRYPDNLPIVAAKGGPGGKPSCGSLPDVSRNFPARQLVTNTGWGTGLDLRPNPGIGHPWYMNLLPVTRAVPEPPSIRGMGPPAIGPVPYPGAPPYGAPANP